MGSLNLPITTCTTFLTSESNSLPPSPIPNYDVLPSFPIYLIIISCLHFSVPTLHHNLHGKGGGGVNSLSVFNHRAQRPRGIDPQSPPASPQAHGYLTQPVISSPSIIIINYHVTPRDTPSSPHHLHTKSSWPQSPITSSQGPQSPSQTQATSHNPLLSYPQSKPMS